MSDDETIVAPPPLESPDAEQGVRPEVRQRLLRQFEQWVDRMLAGEEPPAGLPPELLDELAEEEAEASPTAPASAGPPRAIRPERECDLYTLFAGLTTLSGEVRLQGRAFKQLTDTLAPLADVPEQLRRLELLGERQAGEAGGLHASGEEICEAMLDLYDRLERGLRTSDHAIASLMQRRRGWRRWLGLARPLEDATTSAQAIRDSAALTLARLESVLHDWGVERIGRVGEPFDPLRMSVVQVVADPRSDPASVLEVHRSGYALTGQLKRTAQVTVARVEPAAEQI